MLIVEVLQGVQLMLYAILIGAITFALLVIAAYLQEELEYQPAVKEWFLQVSIKIKELLRKIDEITSSMYPEFKMLYVAPKHRPRHRHARVENRNFLEDGFGNFARGFDRTGGLLKKQAPRHASGQLMSSDELASFGLAFPLSS